VARYKPGFFSDAMQGVDEERTEMYLTYFEGALESMTQQCALKKPG